MTDRFRYAQVRQMIIDAMKIDLMGPIFVCIAKTESALKKRFPD